MITEHNSSEAAQVARDADKYDKQRNTTIAAYSRIIYSIDGRKIEDSTASNNKIASNFFHRLNTQRNTYSLGWGVTFSDEKNKEKLGGDFDTVLQHAGYYALIHGVSFLFWNVDHCHAFPMTEFAPVWDEETGALRAGVRYWQIDSDKPMFAVLYEEDGYTKYRSENNLGEFTVYEQKRAYKVKTEKAPADDEPEVIGEENYTSLPIIPLYGNRHKQSTLIGMKSAIDAYDLIQSGFANDLTDCAEVYWLIRNADAMDDSDLSRFRDRLKLTHIAQADEGDVQPYSQDLPTGARSLFLQTIRASIYESFGGLDVHTVAAGATNDHIDAAYQPMDENADEYEYQIIQCVQQLLKLQGIDDTPIFKRNRISNQAAQVQMVLMAKDYIDDETILEKLPFITPDEVKEIKKRKDTQALEQFQQQMSQQAQAQQMQMQMQMAAQQQAAMQQQVGGTDGQDDEDEDES